MSMGLRLIALTVLFTGTLYGQNAPIGRASYIPVESHHGKTPYITSYFKVPIQSGGGFKALGVAAQPLQAARVAPNLSCPNPPSSTEVLDSGFSYQDSLLTTSEAASLSIPFVKIDGSSNTVVLVRDYVSSLECLASDNKTLLTYGVSLRTILTIDGYNARVDGSYALIAADATYNHKVVKLNIQAKGIYNQKYFSLIGSISGKDFNVQDFPAFHDSTSAMIKLIGDQSTTLTPELLGVVTILRPMTLTKAPAITWALSQIILDKTCSEALSDYYDSKAVFPRDAIRSTYVSIDGSCDSSTIPDTAQKEAASTYLAGLKAAKQK